MFLIKNLKLCFYAPVIVKQMCFRVAKLLYITTVLHHVYYFKITLIIDLCCEIFNSTLRLVNTGLSPTEYAYLSL